MIAETDARARIDALAATNPAAATLAGLLSGAVRIEPELVRRMRLLITTADVSAEADLWASDLLASATPNGMVFEPEVARVLRSDLARTGDPARRDEALRLIATAHRDQHWSLRLEERVNALEIRSGAAAVDQQEELLLAAVRELQDSATSQDETSRVGIARWLLGFYARLPDQVRLTGASFAAHASAGLQLDGRAPMTTDAPGGAADTWLPWLLRSAGATSNVGIGVRLAPGRLELGVQAPGAATIELPATDPLVVEVDGENARGHVHHRVELRTDTPFALPLDLDEVTLTTLAGRRFTVRRKGTRPTGGLDFSAVRAGLRPCLEAGDLTNQLVRAVTDPGRQRTSGWVVLSGSAGIGKSVLLGAVLDEVTRRGGVVAQHFYGIQPAWDSPQRVASSLVDQLQSALPGVDWTPPATIEPERRLAWALDVLKNHRPRPDVVLALDGLPGDDPDELRQWLWDAPFTSKPPSGVVYLATARHGQGVGDWLESGDPWMLRSLDSELPADEICRAMLDHAAPTLRAAFGEPGTGAPHRDGLLALAGGRAGRLAGIVAWLVEQPAGTARVATIPLSLTARLDAVWERLGTQLDSRWFLASAVAVEGCTIQDIRQAADVASERLTEGLQALAEAGLLRLGGDPAAPTTTVGPTHPSVTEELAARRGLDSIVTGHTAHAAAVPDEPDELEDASPYQIAAAVRHCLASGQSDKASWLVRQTTFLERRAREGGIVALQDDLASVIEAGPERESDPDLERLRQAVSSIGPASVAAPERFGDLLANEVHRLGGRLTPRWPLALSLERIVDLSGVLVTTFSQVGDASDGDPSSVEWLFPSSWGTDIRTVRIAGRPDAFACGDASGVRAIAAGQLLRYRRGTNSSEIQLGSNVTVLASDGETVAAGLEDGAVMVVRFDEEPVASTLLLSHTNMVTGLLFVDDALVSTSADGTVRVWDMAKRELRHIYRHHHAPVQVVCRCAGGVASGDEAGAVRLWTLDGQDLATFPGHRAAVTALIEVGTSYVVSTGLDGAIWRWATVGVPDRAAALRRDGAPVLAAALSAPNVLVT